MILRTMFDGTSKRQYGGKNSVTAVLYCRPASLRSSTRPAILALPLELFQVSTFKEECGNYTEILLRSINATRYKTASSGTSL